MRMQQKRRNGSASTQRPVEEEIAHLRGLDLRGIRSRWQSVFGRPAPAHLTRHLLFAVIAYRLQADRFGDLDHATRQVLDRTVAKEAEPAMAARLASFDQKRTVLTPGTVLVREWDRQSRRVMVMANGLPVEFTLDACRHGGMTELEESDLTDGQGRALSAHRTHQSYAGYAKRTEACMLSATRKRHAHRLANQMATSIQNERLDAIQNENSGAARSA
jgi:Protein of unknown function (DUF2924)